MSAAGTARFLPTVEPPSTPENEPAVALCGQLERLGVMIGGTPSIRLEVDDIDLFVKLEVGNLTGSVKDRPAHWILSRAIDAGLVTERTTVVESSSGNFAVALATLCRGLGIAFVPVIDPNINPTNERRLRVLCREVVKVDKRDATGGYLLTRLEKVRELAEGGGHVYWPDQYGNPWNAEAHELGTGAELCEQVPELDYLFVGVSSGGTIAGLESRCRRAFPSLTVVAVDVEGSVVFGGPPGRRYIPGIGSSLRPALVDRAVIDDVVVVSETDSVRGCREMLDRHGLFLGGSSGSVYCAIQSYFRRHLPSGSRPPRVAFIGADRGTPYLDTVYDAEWVGEHLGA